MLLEGKNINLRTVEISDALFVLELRKDATKNKHLSKVDTTLEAQEKWIVDYKKREKSRKEYYFVIEDKEKQNVGLVRVYDFIGQSFCWGSWIIKDSAPRSAAIESALCIYEFAFYNLGFMKSHFDVRKENQKVLAFHKRFGAVIVGESDIDFYFEYSLEDYQRIKQKYKKYLPN
ncbi:GNAT family N-acetyltransferase [Francisella philomiragia]|uniref:GNAT family N-acetyltransferase n=1 Tax=Francisella philomiragia TaxID=28110 RepID=A0ABS1G9V1_9GAMM|nr:GNAT family N-acetyltransferase [Francisella philomiragia]MBK2257740.1 GNAT family N-acetyltransferase [Francisella philomiragia]MBK2301428.1 GNAT family N-acetyltransferase [Francisella philomiragia]